MGKDKKKKGKGAEKAQVRFHCWSREIGGLKVGPLGPSDLKERSVDPFVIPGVTFYSL